MPPNHKLQVLLSLHPMSVCMGCRCTLRLGAPLQVYPAAGARGPRQGNRGRMTPGRGRGGNWVLGACVAGAERHCISTRWCTNPPRRTWKKKAKIARWNQEAPPSSLQWPATALYWQSLESQHCEREMLGSSPLTPCGWIWSGEAPTDNQHIPETRVWGVV